MKLTVDRIEGVYAVCETKDRRVVEIPLEEFDYTPKDGDVILYEGGHAKKLEEETDEKKQAMDDLFQSLLKK